MSQKREILRMERIKTDHRGIRILTDAKLNLFDGETVGVLGLIIPEKQRWQEQSVDFFPVRTERLLTWNNSFRLHL